MAFINPMIDIALIGIVFSIISFILQRKLIDRKKMKANQEKMNENQKKISELSKKNDNASKKEAERLQQEMLSDMGKTMNASMKHMVVLLVIAMPILWFMQYAYAKDIIQLPFEFPFIGLTTTWVIWYILVSITTSIVLTIIDKLYLEKKMNW